MINVPVYYSRGCELAGPYLLLLLEKLDWVLASCWTAIDSAAQYIPPMKEKVFLPFKSVMFLLHDFIFLFDFPHIIPS